MLDRVAATTGSRGQVFEDWISMGVCALAGGTMEDEYLAIVQKYAAGEKGKRPVDQLAAAFGRLVSLMTETRADILGDLFQGAITYGERGQYFTPENLCDLMAQLTVADDVGAGAKVCDCCCGSGRMLLAAAKINPHRLFIGQDVDLRRVKITAINLALNNLAGYTIWGNSLANERKLAYQTGFNGRGAIRQVPAEEMPTVPALEQIALLARSEPPEIGNAEKAATQGMLFDGME